jgi:uncharacterized protein (TIGR02594 family)
MRLKNLLAGAVVLCLFSGIVPASANPALDFIMSQNADATAPTAAPAASGNAPTLLATARRSLGANHRSLGVPRSLWCADAVNIWLSRSGMTPVPSRRARDMVKAGRRISRPQPGAIAVFKRGRGGGHVAIVDKVEAGGFTAVSPNYSGKVSLVRYRTASAIAFVLPAS